MRYFKAQSSMEYLTVYGWSIAVAVGVLSMLFALGLFERTTFSQSACTPVPGYLCQVPILATNGMLSIAFSQTVGTITITGTSCTSNTTPPTTFNSVFFTEVSGSVIQLSFTCPLKSNTLGSEFTGHLWVSYNTLTQSALVSDFASITTGVVQVSHNPTSTTTSTTTSSTTTTKKTTTIKKKGTST